MNWGTIKEAIRQAVISATELEDGRVQWVNNPSAGTWRNSPLVDLVLGVPQAVGVDEIRSVYDEEADKLVRTVEGPRQFMVSVRIEAESQLDTEESVGQLASDLRTRMRRPSLLAALRLAGVSLARMEPTIGQDFLADDRMVSLSITDMLFLSAETDTDTTDPGDYIQTAEVSSESLGVPPFQVTISEE